MKITVCRCPVCGSANISALAWVDPNKVCNGMMLLHNDNITWSDRDGGVYCDDCDEESDCWNEEEVEGTVRDGKVYLYDDDGSLVTIQDWCASHPYETDDEEEEDE